MQLSDRWGLYFRSATSSTSTPAATGSWLPPLIQEIQFCAGLCRSTEKQHPRRSPWDHPLGFAANLVIRVAIMHWINSGDKCFCHCSSVRIWYRSTTNQGFHTPRIFQDNNQKYEYKGRDKFAKSCKNVLLWILDSLAFCMGFGASQWISRPVWSIIFDFGIGVQPVYFRKVYGGGFHMISRRIGDVLYCSAVRTNEKWNIVLPIAYFAALTAHTFHEFTDPYPRSSVYVKSSTLDTTI